MQSSFTVVSLIILFSHHSVDTENRNQAGRVGILQTAGSEKCEKNIHSAKKRSRTSSEEGLLQKQSKKSTETLALDDRLNLTASSYNLDCNLI